jgi:flagellar motor switch protein FliN
MSEMNEQNLDLLWDVNVNVYVRLGSCSLPMKEIVGLEPGSVVQLNEKAEDLVGFL